MPAEPIKVLFICTGNCCRSQMAEAILRHLGGERFEAFSAGAAPAGYIHELAVEALARMGISTEGQYSKSWNEFADRPMDIVITVCDSAASQPCPTWPGRAAVAHWSLPDPSFLPLPPAEKIEAAVAVAAQARHWIEQLIALPLETMTQRQREDAVRRIASF
jgi:arsenate reductase